MFQGTIMISALESDMKQQTRWKSWKYSHHNIIQSIVCYQMHYIRTLLKVLCGLLSGVKQYVNLSILKNTDNDKKSTSNPGKGHKNVSPKNIREEKASTRRGYNAVSRLGQRLRRWPNIKTTLGLHLVLCKRINIGPIPVTLVDHWASAETECQFNVL